MKAPVPAKLPHLHTILDNLGLPDKQVAHFLGVSPSSVKRWREAGQAPRPVMLALYWETDWGRSAVACDAVNWGRMLHMQNMSLQSQVKTLKKRIAKLEKALAAVDTAANSPIFEVS